ncbi:hypothetical protein BJX65DRAFT_307880 [Aspergillus insuetus]
MHRRRKQALLRHRTALVRALYTPVLDNLERLRIELNEHTPLDHGFEGLPDRDDAYPGGVLINRPVCRLARENLRELHVEGAWPILPALFGACGEAEEREMLAFPNLKIMEIRFPIVTYDGRWLFTGEPEDVKTFDSTDVRPPRPADLTNSSTTTRTPDREVFNPIMKALVKASVAMPHLEHLRAQTAPLGVERNEMEIEYVAPACPAETIPCEQQDGAMLGKRRGGCFGS